MSSQKALGKGSSMPPHAENTLRLYSMRFCPYAKRVRLVLAHKQIPYETVNINLTEKPEWYFQLNPEGKVPLLQKNNRFLYESIIIAEYIDDVFDFKKLQQADPFLRAKEKLYLEKFSKITDFLYKLHYNTEIESLFQEVFPTFLYYEDMKATQSKFFGGDSPSFLDFMMWPWFETFKIIYELHPNLPLEVILPQNKFPYLRKWMEDMMEVPAVQECHTPIQHAQFFKSLREGRRDYDAGLQTY